MLLTGFAPASLTTALGTVSGADGLIAVTPIFSGSYAGLFKNFFDVLDEGALEGMPVLMGATAGTARHSLALDHAVRPLFTYLHALVVPTVFDADRKSLGQIARESRALAERVRAGAITPPELSSGTFTVSNLGMFGITRFVAVINPPQAAILAVGALEPRPVVRDGEVTVRSIMELTLSCDHRILYGADAAEFLAKIREYLEQPLRLAL